MFFTDRVVVFNELFRKSRTTANVVAVLRLQNHWLLKSALSIILLVFFSILLLLTTSPGGVYSGNFGASYFFLLMLLLTLVGTLEYANRKLFFKLHPSGEIPSGRLSYEDKKYWRTFETVRIMNLSSSDILRLIKWKRTEKKVVDGSLVRPLSYLFGTILAPVLLVALQSQISYEQGFVVWYFIAFFGVGLSFIHAGITKGLNIFEHERTAMITFLERAMIEAGEI